MLLFSVAKQLNIRHCMSVCLSVCLFVCLSDPNFVPNFSYIIKEVIEVDELDKDSISAAAGKIDK